MFWELDGTFPSLTVASLLFIRGRGRTEALLLSFCFALLCCELCFASWPPLPLSPTNACSCFVFFFRYTWRRDNCKSVREFEHSQSKKEHSKKNLPFVLHAFFYFWCFILAATQTVVMMHQHSASIIQWHVLTTNLW
jgi:hypothetical protein